MQLSPHFDQVAMSISVCSVPSKLQELWPALVALLLVASPVTSHPCSGQETTGEDAPSEIVEPEKSQATTRLEELMKQLEQLDREAARAENAVDRESESSDQESEGKTLVDDDESTSDRPIPRLVDGRFALPSLAPPSIATDDIGNGSVPKGFKSSDTFASLPLPQSGMQRPIDSSWAWSTMYWAAPNTFSNPRYFEDRMVERHGQTRWGYLQPVVSGARFFTTIPMLPYKATIEPPCECQYTLGYLRAGSCTPAYIERPPWDRRAILAESAAVASGMLIFP
ncbi:MAG: hypothetical protein AAF664_15190 [Planctomycetota bacterium]